MVRALPLPSPAAARRQWRSRKSPPSKHTPAHWRSTVHPRFTPNLSSRASPIQHLLPFSLESVDRTLDLSRDLSAPRLELEPTTTSHVGLGAHRHADAPTEPSVWSRPPSPCAPTARLTGRKDIHGDARSRPRARATHARRARAGRRRPQRGRPRAVGTAAEDTGGRPAGSARTIEYVYVQGFECSRCKCKSPELPAGWGR